MRPQRLGWPLGGVNRLEEDVAPRHARLDRERLVPDDAERLLDVAQGFRSRASDPPEASVHDVADRSDEYLFEGVAEVAGQRRGL